tara:strand:- start:60 stop:347 length:288 start_codon:yes stop_codon:yes gene_type:complete
MNVNEANVLTSQYTFSLVNTGFTIPQGARTIDMYNISPTTEKVYFIGNSSQGLLTLSAVSIASGQNYSFPDLGKPYPAIPITGDVNAVIEISVTY